MSGDHPAPAREASAAPPPAAPFGDEPTRRRHFRLGVANGAVYQGGDSFIDSSAVIPVLLAGLTRSNVLIGLAVGLGDMGWFLPQVFVAPWASRRARQMWLYRISAIVRSVSLFAIAILAWPLRENPGALLAAFFVFYPAYSFGAGLGGPAFMEIVGRTVPPERLGSYFSQRMFWGGLAGAIAGLIVREVFKFGSDGLHFAVLFGLAGAVCTVAYALFIAVREPEVPASPTVATPLALLREGFAWLRHDPVFRRLFLARTSLSVWFTASPFMVLLAVRDLGGGGRVAGTFLLARIAGFVLSNLLWHDLSRRRGNGEIMRVATAAACCLMLAAAVVAVLSPRWLGVIDVQAAVIALEAIAFLGGAAHSGLVVGFSALVIEMAPAGKRQAFVSLMSTFLGPTLLLPALGGAIVDVANAPTVFVLCALAGLVCYRAAARLPASRPADAVVESAAAPIEHGESR